MVVCHKDGGWLWKLFQPVAKFIRRQDSFLRLRGLPPERKERGVSADCRLERPFPLVRPLALHRIGHVRECPELSTREEVSRRRPSYRGIVHKKPGYAAAGGSELCRICHDYDWKFRRSKEIYLVIAERDCNDKSVHPFAQHRFKRGSGEVLAGLYQAQIPQPAAAKIAEYPREPHLAVLPGRGDGDVYTRRPLFTLILHGRGSITYFMKK